MSRPALHPGHMKGSKLFLGTKDISVFFRLIRSRGLEVVGDLKSSGHDYRVLSAQTRDFRTGEPKGERWGWYNSKAGQWEVFKDRPAHLIDEVTT